MITDVKLMEADRYFIILELVLIALFLIGLGSLVSKVLGGGWIILWLVVLVGTLVPLAVHWRPAWVRQVFPGLTAGRGPLPFPVRGSGRISRGRTRHGGGGRR